MHIPTLIRSLNTRRLRGNYYIHGIQYNVTLWKVDWIWIELKSSCIHISRWAGTADNQLCTRKKFISACGVLWKTAWPLCDKTFTFGYSQEAAEDGRHSNQSVPAHLHHPLSSELLIHLWTEILCLFSFLFSLQSFGGKLNLMPRGRMENWAK